MSPLDRVMDAQAANQAERLAIYNPDTPEIDSLVELVLAAPLDPAWKQRLLVSVQRVTDWNDSESRCELDALRVLDAQAPRSLRDTIGVRGAAHRLRPVLGRGDLVREAAVVRELLDNPQCGPRVLRQRSLRGQLGCKQYARLLELLELEGAPA